MMTKISPGITEIEASAIPTTQLCLARTSAFDAPALASASAACSPAPKIFQTPDSSITGSAIAVPSSGPK
jgi:hypothetical protein